MASHQLQTFLAMNLIVRIVIIAALGSIAQVFWPWWSSVAVALLVETFLGKKDGTAFFSGFYGVAIPWMVLSGYIDVSNNYMLSHQILRLFKLPEFSLILVIITGLLGGMVAGFGSLTGSWMRTAFDKSNG